MVVRPLVDESTKFDILATVWARCIPEVDEPGAIGPCDLDGERSIFSDVIFRGATLEDGHAYAAVNLSVPLKSL